MKPYRELSAEDKERQRERVRQWRKRNPGKSSKPMREWTAKQRRAKYEYLRDKNERLAWMAIGKWRKTQPSELDCEMWIASPRLLDTELFRFEYRGTKTSDIVGLQDDDAARWLRQAEADTVTAG